MIIIMYMHMFDNFFIGIIYNLENIIKKTILKVKLGIEYEEQ